ncbi:MAG: transposase [Granulosicoccus sp.]
MEPNRNLGKAMQYFIRHYDGLTAFCNLPGAPVDYNEIERLIKLLSVQGKIAFPLRPLSVPTYPISSPPCWQSVTRTM